MEEEMNNPGLNYQVDAKPRLWKSLLSSAFPIAGNLLQGFLDYRAQKKSNQRNLQQSQELAKFRWDEEKRLMAENLAYNTPKMQMERFKSAGLNPNLIYSRGSSGEAPTIQPKYGDMGADMTLPSPVKLPKLSQFYDSKMMAEQLSQARSQSRSMSAKAVSDTNNAIAQGYFLMEEAFAKAKIAGYKGQKADFDKEIMSIFQNTYKTSQVDQWSKAKPELQKTQYDAKIRQIERDTKEKEYEYLSKGLPWLIPLNAIFGNLLRIKNY